MSEALSIPHTAPAQPDPGEWLTDVRERAADAFREQGFPGKQHESWKYTSLGAMEPAMLAPVRPGTADTRHDPLPESTIITLVDGMLDADQSNLPEGMSVLGLDGPALPHATASLLRELHRPEDLTAEDATQVALNFAHATQALLLQVPKGKHLDTIVEIHHIHTGAAGGHYTQLWLDLAADSQLTLLERFYGTDAGKQASLQNHVSYIRLQRGAQLYHYRLQDVPQGTRHLYTQRLTQSDHSEYRSFTMTTGATLSRLENRAELQGRHLRCDQQGVTLGRHNQHHDAYLPVTHHQPESYSNQHFRQLLDDQAKGVFYGTVHVPQASIKTEAHQLNHNILLSPKAQAYTRPELDIFTDDVVCSHGATVGNLDEHALYYLQARGLDADQARRILVRAFAEEIIEAIPSPAVRELMHAHVDATIATEEKG